MDLKNLKRILKTKLCKNKSVVLKLSGKVNDSVMKNALFV